MTAAPERIAGLLEREFGLGIDGPGAAWMRQAIAEQRARLDLDWRSYAARLESEPALLRQLAEAGAVGETWFMRYPESFELLVQACRERVGAVPLRILSLPCSTGEEVWSTAIALAEAGLTPEQVQVLGVDLRRDCVEVGRLASYRSASFRGPPSDVVARYTWDVEGARFVEEGLRPYVEFVSGNAVDPELLAGQQFDIVFFRNLLMYMRPSGRRRSLSAVERLLAPGGLLFVGHTDHAVLGSSSSYRKVGPTAAYALERVAVPV